MHPQHLLTTFSYKGDYIKMIENLKGIHETVNYKKDTNLRLYDNDESENYPSHWHTPLEIIMPTINIYTVTLGDDIIQLNAYDIIFISPGVIHALSAPETGFGKRIIFQAEITMFYQITELESLLASISPVLTLTPYNAPHIHEKIKQLLLEIKDTYICENNLSETSIYARLLDVFVLLSGIHISTINHFNFKNQKQYTDKFLSICNYISEHCTEELSLEEVAQIAGFSKFYFTRLFKEFTNTTFYKYLNTKRIGHAQQLLTHPEYSITEVALHSGFSSPTAFIRMFKIMKSCTPTEFRNMYDKS